MPLKSNATKALPPVEVSEREIDAALAACAGDARATIRALLVGQTYLEQEIARLQGRVSAGYCRNSKARAPVDGVECLT